MSGKDRRKRFAPAGWLLVGLALALAPAALALEAVEDGGFDLPISTSPWQRSGTADIVGGIGELQDGGSLSQILNDPAKLPGQAAGLYFEHDVQGTYLEVSLNTEIESVANQLVLQIFPGDPSPFFYEFTGGEIIPLGATLRFTFAGAAYEVAHVDNVSLEITTIVVGPTGTPVGTETPAVPPTSTPVATPTGPTPTPTPTATGTGSPTPLVTATPTPPAPTPTPNQRAVRLQLSANPNFLQGQRDQLPQLRSVIRMSVVNVNGTVLTNTGSGGFYANVSGPGTLGGVSPSIAYPGVFEADFIPYGEGRCVVEVLYSGGLLPAGADPLTNSVAVSINVAEKGAVAPGPPLKKTLYQREQ